MAGPPPAGFIQGKACRFQFEAKLRTMEWVSIWSLENAQEDKTSDLPLEK